MDVSDSTNPYQAPLSDSLGVDSSPHPGSFIGDRLEFNGEITAQHHRDAVSKAGIRKEYRNSIRVMITLSGLFGLCAVVLLLATQNPTTNLTVRCLGSMALFGGGVSVFFFNQRWMVGRLIPGYQLTIGNARGWMDRQRLRVETRDQKNDYPLDQLVSSAATHDIWVLCFSKDVSFWQTIPFEAFDDPQRARQIASDLQQIWPSVLPQVVDDRKRAVPDEAFCFDVGNAPVWFEGNFYHEAALDTRLVVASKRVARRVWLALYFFLACILGSILLLVGFRLVYLGIACLWILAVVCNVYFRVWRAKRRAKQDGRTIIWYSKGWLDDFGYCAMTAIGQSRSAWTRFDHFEITDESIGLYPHESDACCCLVGREQFSDANDWHRAVAKVRQFMSPQ